MSYLKIRINPRALAIPSCRVEFRDSALVAKTFYTDVASQWKQLSSSSPLPTSDPLFSPFCSPRMTQYSDNEDEQDEGIQLTQKRLCSDSHHSNSFRGGTIKGV